MSDPLDRAIIRAQPSPWRRSVEFYIGTRDGGTRVKDIILENAAYQPDGGKASTETKSNERKP